MQNINARALAEESTVWDDMDYWIILAIGLVDRAHVIRMMLAVQFGRWNAHNVRKHKRIKKIERPGYMPEEWYQVPSSHLRSELHRKQVAPGLHSLSWSNIKNIRSRWNLLTWSFIADRKTMTIMLGYRTVDLSKTIQKLCVTIQSVLLHQHRMIRWILPIIWISW